MSKRYRDRRDERRNKASVEVRSSAVTVRKKKAVTVPTRRERPALQMGLPIVDPKKNVPVQGVHQRYEAPEERVKKAAQKPWMNDLRSMTLDTGKKRCKKRPSSNKGDGSSRGFVPWCEKGK